MHDHFLSFRVHLQPILFTPTMLYSGKCKKHQYIDINDDDDENNRILDNDGGGDDDDNDGSLADSSTSRSGTAGQFKFVRFQRSPAVLGGPFVNTKPHTITVYPTTTTTNRPLYDNLKCWCTNFGYKDRRFKKVGSSESRFRRSYNGYSKGSVRRQYADFLVNIVAARQSRPIGLPGKRSVSRCNRSCNGRIKGATVVTLAI